MAAGVIKNDFLSSLLGVGLVILPIASHAEGVIDIKPHVGANISYDDNVFRFSSPKQAQAAFGSSATSDVIKRVDIGLDVNIRLSRQLLSLSSNFSQSQYNRFQLLDNTGKDYKLAWNWQVGNDLYGELSAGQSEAIAGFNEVKSPVNNLRTFTTKRANINWNLMPDWTLHATGESASVKNELASFNSLDRDDHIVEAGILYKNPAATQLGVDYRVNVSSFPNRIGFTQAFFGDESTQKELVINAAIVPTLTTRISTRLSGVRITYPDVPERDISGFSQRWNLDHAFTENTSINLSAYREIAPVDDVLSTYVRAKGYSINPLWNITSIVSLRAGYGVEQREYAGNSRLFINNADNRSDQSKIANLSLTYTPTEKSLLQVQYQGEKRTSSDDGQGYQYNSLNFTARYDF